MIDPPFPDAVAAIDAGDIETLERLLAGNPWLVRNRLEGPAPWLRDVVGKALDGFFRRPYLLWFVAEDPVRNGKLPPNIPAVAHTIVGHARRESPSNLQEQLDYALTLVSWSWIARECGVQIALIDVLADAGATLAANADNALVNGNVAAAEHLVRRGADLTLAAAVAFGWWADVDRLLATTNHEQKQFAFVLSALNGKADALRRLIRAGIDVNARSSDLHSHGTPLHHAVASGSLEAVQALVDAGADVGATDTAWGGTPLGWAQHHLEHPPARATGAQYAEIASLLRERQPRS